MNTRSTRFALRRLVAGGALATFLLSGSALAQDHDFNLPAQPMASCRSSSTSRNCETCAPRPSPAATAPALHCSGCWPAPGWSWWRRGTGS